MESQECRLLSDLLLSLVSSSVTAFHSRPITHAGEQAWSGPKGPSGRDISNYSSTSR